MGSHAAVAAGAVQDDIVVVERVPVGARDPAEGSLETGVVEGLDFPAGTADEVMVMLSPRVRGLEARHAVTEVDATHEP